MNEFEGRTVQALEAIEEALPTITVHIETTNNALESIANMIIGKFDNQRPQG